MATANQMILDRERQIAILVELQKMNVTLNLIFDELKTMNRVR